MHAADQAVEDPLFTAGDAICEARLVVNGRPDPVGMLTLQQPADRQTCTRSTAATSQHSSLIQQHPVNLG